ncbi:MAG: putative membrane protein [Candidatus Roizmanbacteria bacterium GW2011_GWA2_36_23]|uniref:Putative membrane protein n=1 Tax=Candidatus Roizmanbacteria bacterium GW2011_GWA2_36_23 TaxID=1618480 RepID=A0A0G0E827_9BACT|nr:MAG: putative membrane protein [Candidatus Roizmanbacteria bacterium GW2011_GWA2_36_23]
MSRIDQARKGYLGKNIRDTNKAHSKSVIHQSLHKEKHITSFNLPEIILGGQDGLVNVLGVILGVAAATSSSQIVIVAGLAATFAESISMAAVAYTSKLAEADYYQSELEREAWEIQNVPDGEREEIRALYENYGFKGKTLNEIVNKITSDKQIWLKVMMEQELKLEETDRKQAFPSAFIVGISSLIGSIIPLIPFFFFYIQSAIFISIIASAIVLFSVGYYKAKVTIGRSFIKNGIEMMLIGIISALVGYVIGNFLKV